MKPRLPIYVKILFWFSLNLVLVGVAMALLLSRHLPLGLNSLLMDKASERFQALSQVLAGELDHTPSQDWDSALERLGKAYRMLFFVFRCDGTQVAGPKQSLPAEVASKVQRCGPGMMMYGRGMMMRGMGTGPNSDEKMEAFRRNTAPSIVRTANPARYWLLAPLPLAGPASGQPAVLVAMTDSLQTSHLGFDLRPLGIAAVVIFLFSALLWLLPVRNLTHAITQISRATNRMAQGQLDVRVPSRRRDELGDLGQSINHMAAQLESLLQGQKRFLGDTAHELCSPIGRLQLSLAILEQRLGTAHKEDLTNVRREVEHMADLVNELLSFSKASLGHTSVKLQPVWCRSVAERAAQREAVPGVRIELNIPGDLCVLADPDLLERALANVLRNAVRYAGQAGPITIIVGPENGHVQLIVSDAGPGVPDKELPHIFAPFYRVDAARTPGSGGVGLGLAIVKTCIESCGGTVTARNRQPSGFEVIVNLSSAPGEGSAKLA